MQLVFKTRALGRAAVLGALVATAASPAAAYIDPGTGSMILQVIGASVAGSMFYFRELRMKFLAMFGRRSAGSDADPTNASSSESARG